MNFESLFVNPNGRTSRGPFVPALLVLLAVVVFYAFVVKGRTAQWCLMVLVYPAVVLHARRLRDMGRSVWLLFVPAVLVITMLALRLQLFSLGTRLDALVPAIALAVAALAALWGCVGKASRA